MQLNARSRFLRYRSSGFTLIEVLVAVLVMALALLGLAGLQTLGVTSSNNAYYYTQAIYLANDMADRMRSNQPGIAAGDYDGVLKAGNCFLEEDGCDSASNAAKADFTNWCNSLANQLPAGTGVVTFSAGTHADCQGVDYTAPNGTATITIMWDNDRTGAAGRGCGTDTFTDLTCYQVRLQL